MHSGHIGSMHKHITLTVALLAPIVGLAISFVIGVVYEGVAGMARTIVAALKGLIKNTEIQDAEITAALQPNRRQATISAGLAFAALMAGFAQAREVSDTPARKPSDKKKEVEGDDVLTTRITENTWFDCRFVIRAVEKALRHLGRPRAKITVLNRAYNPLELSAYFNPKGHEVDLSAPGDDNPQSKHGKIEYLLSMRKKADVLVCQLPLLTHLAQYQELNSQRRLLEELGYEEFARVHDPTETDGADAFVFVRTRPSSPSSEPVMSSLPASLPVGATLIGAARVAQATATNKRQTRRGFFSALFKGGDATEQPGRADSRNVLMSGVPFLGGVDWQTVAISVVLLGLLIYLARNNFQPLRRLASSVGRRETPSVAGKILRPVAEVYRRTAA
jgi:hypothetical protein